VIRFTLVGDFYEARRKREVVHSQEAYPRCVRKAKSAVSRGLAGYHQAAP